MAVIGIDLGTTNSLGAYWKGRVYLIPMEDGNFLLPSVVGYVEEEGFLAGTAAKERLIFYPEDTAASFKRFMGTAKTYRRKSVYPHGTFSYCVGADKKECGILFEGRDRGGCYISSRLFQ